jgi:hypothetical protein
MFKQYFYSRETLELMADDVNRKYYPERLDSVLPLDPYDLLEKQGLDVEWKYISPNEQLLGLIFFADERNSLFGIKELFKKVISHTMNYSKKEQLLSTISLLRRRNTKRKKYLFVLMKIATGLKTKNILKTIQKTSFRFVILNL